MPALLSKKGSKSYKMLGSRGSPNYHEQYYLYDGELPTLLLHVIRFSPGQLISVNSIVANAEFSHTIGGGDRSVCEIVVSCLSSDSV